MQQPGGVGPDPIPDPVREPFRALYGEVVRLHFRWLLFKQLYVRGQTRVDLLNEMAGGLFYQLQYIMMDDVVMAAARLLDPAHSFGQENLTLNLLRDRVAASVGPDIVSELDARIAQLLALSDPLRRHRNKRIAHADYQHHPAIVGSVLPGIAIRLVDDVLKEIAEAMNVVQRRFERGTTVYDMVSGESDADTLVWNLRKAADWGHFVGDALAQAMRLQVSPYHDA